MAGETLAERIYKAADELLLHDGDRDHMNLSHFANGSDLQCEQVQRVAKAMRWLTCKMGYSEAQ